MTDIAVDTLRLRGTAARRLTTVAATTLPRALDRALADLDDVEIDRVTVLLELDVDDYDDEALAVLWADAIRAKVLQLVPPGRPRPPTRRSAGPPGDGPATPSLDDVVAVAHTWLSAEWPGGRRAVPAPIVRALAEPEVAMAVRARMPAKRWSSLIHRLADALHDPPGSPAGQTEAQAPGVITPTASQPSGTRSRADEDLPPDAVRSGGSTTEPDDVETHDQAVLVRLAALADVVADSVQDVSADAMTQAAGLALVYPWLSDHCRRAEALHPGLEPVDVREAALAAVLSDDDPTLPDDPLVRFLAGRGEQVGAPDHHRALLAHSDEVADSARAVLASFAALLPGFERSTPGFVRDAWIVRVGLLDLDHDPALLTPATHPLDVVLPRLPFPVGLVKLPWSPPLSVRFR